MVSKYWQPAHDELHCFSNYYSSLSCYFALDTVPISQNNAKEEVKNNEKAQFQLLYILCIVIEICILCTYIL